MKKFFPTAKPERIPLGVLVGDIVGDLYLVLAGNGYKNVGFQLIVQNLEDNEVAGSGNMKPEGVITLLNNALATVNEHIENEKGKPSAPNDGITKH